MKYRVDQSHPRTIEVLDERGQTVAYIWRGPRKDGKEPIARANEICAQLNEKGYVSE